jgi:hypothetical protein
MSREPAPSRHAAIRALTGRIVGAGEPWIMSIVASVSAVMRRGPAAVTIEPLHHRLAALGVPRPLSFGRLLFHPLDLVIVPASRWRPGWQAIPRSELMPMAEQVRLMMGAAATAIEAEIGGRTTADTELISRLGRSLWPEAACIVADAPIPLTWDATELGERNYWRLAEAVAALLAEAPGLDTLCAEAATGLLPPPGDVIEALLSRVARASAPALPMMIAVLLDRLPEAAGLLPAALTVAKGAATRPTTDHAAEVLLRQLEQEDAIETRVAIGTLADAGAAVRRIAAVLGHLDSANPKPERRDWVRALRQRLGASGSTRFASGLENELLAPLRHTGNAPDPDGVPVLEAAARGLRVLETEGRVVGGGSTYDLLLARAAEAVEDSVMGDRLSRADQLRLVEILSGPDVALAMLDRTP